MNDLGWGLQIAGLGIATVFGLLALLMGTLVLMGRLDRPGAEPPSDAAPATGQDSTPGVRIEANGLTDDAVAAITIAVLTHAEVSRRQAAPAMRAFQPGSRLFASHWVNVGRFHQTSTWRRR